MFEKEIAYGKTLLSSSGYLPEQVMKKMTVVRRWADASGNPWYSFIYNGKKAVVTNDFLNSYGVFTIVKNKKDL